MSDFERCGKDLMGNIYKSNGCPVWRCRLCGKHYQKLIMCAIIILVGVYVANEVIRGCSSELTYVNCCDGMVCTDTYYTLEDNLCHLTLCEHNPFDTTCVYPGKNISTCAVDGISGWING